MISQNFAATTVYQSKQAYRNRHIDPHLTSLDVFLEVCSRTAGAGEDGDAIAIFIRVDELNRGIEGGGFEGDEDGAEDFFRVAFHVRFDIGN